MTGAKMLGMSAPTDHPFGFQNFNVMPRFLQPIGSRQSRRPCADYGNSHRYFSDSGMGYWVLGIG
jgi:hypothetical protein